MDDAMELWGRLPGATLERSAYRTYFHLNGRTVVGGRGCETERVGRAGGAEAVASSGESETRGKRRNGLLIHFVVENNAISRHCVGGRSASLPFSSLRSCDSLTVLWTGRASVSDWD